MKLLQSAHIQLYITKQTSAITPQQEDHFQPHGQNSTESFLSDVAEVLMRVCVPSVGGLGVNEPPPCTASIYTYKHSNQGAVNHLNTQLPVKKDCLGKMTFSFSTDHINVFY